jgi:hypothetical protein
MKTDGDGCIFSRAPTHNSAAPEAYEIPMTHRVPRIEALLLEKG